MPDNTTNNSTGQREKLLEKGLDFFYGHGIREVDEARLFKEMEVSADEFYSFFKSKDDLLDQAIQHSRKRQEAVYSSLRDSSENAVVEIMSVLKHGADIFKKINPRFISDIVEHYPQIMESAAQYSRDYTLGLYAAILNRGISENLFRSDINIPIITRVIVENGYVFLNHRTFPPNKYSSGEVLRSIYLYFFRGLCLPQGAFLVDEYFSNNSF